MSTPTKKYVIFDLDSRRWLRSDTATDNVAFNSISVGGESGPVISATSNNINFNEARLTNISTPQGNYDVATKKYVDDNSAAQQPWTEKNGNYTAVAKDRLLLNSTSSSFTITLPATPAFGDEIVMADGAGYLSLNNVTIARNGNKILGLDEDFYMDTNNVSARFIYYDASHGWAVTQA